MLLARSRSHTVCVIYTEAQLYASLICRLLLLLPPDSRAGPPSRSVWNESGSLYRSLNLGRHGFSSNPMSTM